MRWLTLEYIKQHSRIDSDIEDNILELYAEAAGVRILNRDHGVGVGLLQAAAAAKGIIVHHHILKSTVHRADNNLFHKQLLSEVQGGYFRQGILL